MNVFVIARNKFTSYLFAKTLLAIADARAEGHRISMARSDEHIERLDMFITGQSDNIEQLNRVIGNQIAELRECEALVGRMRIELVDLANPCDEIDMDEYYESMNAVLPAGWADDLPF